MIATLRGNLILKRPDHIVVETNGVGYLVNVPLSLLSELPEEKKEVFLFIHTYVREDTLQLYGFSSEEDKRVFVTLLSISGIGPKVAMNILSTIPTDRFISAIDTEDIDMLCRVPGLGKKTANRMILELKGKLPSLTSDKRRDSVFEDTVSALVNLGYKKSEAVEAIEKAQKAGYNTIETLLKEALRYLTRD